MHTTLKKHIASAIVYGDFRLRGGETSRYYLDIKSLFGDPLLVRNMGKALVQHIPSNTTAIAVSGYGGITLGTVVSQLTKLPLILVRNEQKDHGKSNQLIGYQPGFKDRIIIIDDVYTTGSSIRETKAILNKKKPASISSLVIVKRGNKKPPRNLMWLFDIDELIQ